MERCHCHRWTCELYRCWRLTRLGQSASDSAEVIVETELGNVVMVVGVPSRLIRGEVAVVDRLSVSGYTVAAVDDNAVQASDADGAAFVMVMSTIDSRVLGSKLRDVPHPVWVAKPYALDDMLMTRAMPERRVRHGVVALDRRRERNSRARRWQTGNGPHDPGEQDEVVRPSSPLGGRYRDRGRQAHHIRLPSWRSVGGGRSREGLSLVVFSVPRRTGEFHDCCLGDVRRCSGVRIIGLLNELRTSISS